jgi:phosphoglycerol transferase MdoB-like AlkP superfamily enzyme
MKESNDSLVTLYLWIGAYALILGIFYIIYSKVYFNVEYLGPKSATWSLIFIPLITLVIHMTLLRFLRIYIFVLLLCLDALVDVTVATHWAYFGSAPSVLSLAMANRESSVGVLYSSQFISGWLLVFLSIKMVALIVIAIRIKKSLVAKHIGWGALIAAFLLCFAFVMRSPTEAARANLYEMCIKVHGLYTAAISELVFSKTFLDSDHTVVTADAQKLPNDCMIVPEEYFQSILTIQVESLDWEVIGFQNRGKEATPFLKSLRDQVLLLKLMPTHSPISGSSGADFQFLAMKLPPYRCLALREKALESIPSLPRALARRGIRTVAMHGNSASFWSRGYAYPRLGIDQFIEKKNYPAVDGGWGTSDQTFFDYNAKFINKNTKPTLFFMITLSSHAPFNWVKDAIFPSGDMVFDYLNSIHYTDRSLERFFSQLQGKHLVMIYGDHTSGVQNEIYNYKPDGHEYVPGMLFLLDNGKIGVPEDSCLPDDLQSGRYEIRNLGILLKELVNRNLPARQP